MVADADTDEASAATPSLNDAAQGVVSTASAASAASPALDESRSETDPPIESTNSDLEYAQPAVLRLEPEGGTTPHETPAARREAHTTTPTLFALCLRAISKHLQHFYNSRLYPTTAPPLVKPFELAVSVYDLAPLSLLEEQRCFERIAAAKAAQLEARRAKITSPEQCHRLETVPVFAVSASMDDAMLAPLKSILGVLPPPEVQLRERPVTDTKMRQWLRKREAKWVCNVENRPRANTPEEVDADPSNEEERKKPTVPETLRLIRQPVTNVGCGLLADRLVVGPTLVDLSLQNCQVTCAGAVLLANALRVSSTLRHLDLSNSESNAFRGRMFDNDIRETGAAALASALEANRSLACMSLSNNHVGRHSGAALAKMLRTNATLVQLELSSTSLGDAAEELIESFRRSPTLETLNLQWCRLRPGLGAQLAVIQATKPMRATRAATKGQLIA